MDCNKRAYREEGSQGREESIPCERPFYRIVIFVVVENNVVEKQEQVLQQGGVQIFFRRRPWRGSHHRPPALALGSFPTNKIATLTEFGGAGRLTTPVCGNAYKETGFTVDNHGREY